jgi:hypothetical protein
VIMPAKCVSSVSPRFHYRRLAFCFLPLAAILEFLDLYFSTVHCCSSMALHATHFSLQPCSWFFVSDSWSHRKKGRCLQSAIFLFFSFSFFMRYTRWYQMSVNLWAICAHYVYACTQCSIDSLSLS